MLARTQETVPDSPLTRWGVSMAEEADGRRLADELAAAIRGGVLSPGDRLPTLRALSEQEGVTVGAVRHALRLLADQGLAAGEQGRGWFVTRPRPPAGPSLEERVAAVEERLGEVERQAHRHG